MVDVGDDGDVPQVGADGVRGGGAGGHGGAGVLVHRAAECRTGAKDARPTPLRFRSGCPALRRCDHPGLRGLGASSRRPSKSSITRSATSSITGSWVATTAVTPSARTTVRMQQHDPPARLGVELARGLVREEELGPVGERPGDGDPLLLAARQLVRPVAGPRVEPDELQQLRDPARRAPAAPPRRAGAAPRRSRRRSGSGSARTSGR